MKNLDWGSLSFGYMKTDYNVRCYYRDGKWGEIEATNIPLPGRRGCPTRPLSPPCRSTIP